MVLINGFKLRPLGMFGHYLHSMLHNKFIQRILDVIIMLAPDKNDVLPKL